MPRLIAFLRAINVGGHTVTMDELRRLFAGFGCGDVETFIASGNVIFTSRARDIAALERKIETQLHAALGYEVATFIRTEDEVAAVAKYFALPRLASAPTLNIGFLTAPLDTATVKALATLRTDIDDFHVNGRELYWMCRATRQSDSKVNNRVFEKTLKVRTTFRGANTITRLAQKLGR